MAIEERYGQIIRAARDVFARHGFHRASIREIARVAGLSLAGLYHYTGGKQELLFLVLDRSLDSLIAALQDALAAAETPEARLLALIQTHLEFAFRNPAALKIINRDFELLAEPERSQIAARRREYLEHGLAILNDLDRDGRSHDELFSATNLLLGMLNGIATRPFVRSTHDARRLAEEVARLFLYGFLAWPTDRSPAAVVGGGHDG